MQRTTESPFQVESTSIHGTAVGFRHRLTAAAVIVLLAALALLAPAMGGPHAALAMSDRGGYSGDDAYDPAAGGTPELSVAALPERSAAAVAVSFSGDDAYDPAAGGTSELSVAALPERSAAAVAVSYSGDDAYDPAAGGTPELSVAALPERSAAAVAVTYSGDDDYDPATGARPELSVPVEMRAAKYGGK
jgi:hypothetical protein